MTYFFISRKNNLRSQDVSIFFLLLLLNPQLQNLRRHYRHYCKLAVAHSIVSLDS